MGHGLYCLAATFNIFDLRLQPGPECPDFLAIGLKYHGPQRIGSPARLVDEVMPASLPPVLVRPAGECRSVCGTNLGLITPDTHLFSVRIPGLSTSARTSCRPSSMKFTPGGASSGRQ